MPIRGDRLRWPPRPGKRANETREVGGKREAGNEPATRGTLSTDEHKPAPRQPHERDESPDSQSSPPRDVMRQAHEDATGEQTDTDCRNQAAEIVKRNETKRGRIP